MMKKAALLTMLLALAIGCGSSKKEKELVETKHEGLKKDFIVRDASSNTRPGWVEDGVLVVAIAVPTGVQLRPPKWKLCCSGAIREMVPLRTPI